MDRGRGLGGRRGDLEARGARLGRRILALGLSMGSLLPAAVWAAPLAERVVLPDGLVLVVAEKRALPIVRAHMLVRAGSVLEPKEKAGLANLTAELLTRGTARRTAPEISEAIDFVGGSLSSEGGPDFVAVDLTILKKDLDLGLDLLFDVVRYPRFASEEIQRAVKELQGAIRKKQEEPGQVAGEAFGALVFGEHPYGRPVEGTEASLSAITRDDLVAFHAARYRPNRAILVVVGDVSLAEIKARIEPLLRGWQAGDGADPAPQAPRPLAARTVKEIQRPIAQANIILGHLGVSRDNPDYYAIQVMNYILGSGGFASRLLQNVREEKGWAYDIHSAFVPHRYGGAFSVRLETKNETAGPAVQEVLKEIRRIRAGPVSEAELSEAKSYLTGSFPLRLDTNAKIAGFLGAVEFFGLGLDFADRYPALIEAVTAADVLRVARKYLDPDRYVLVVVGDLAKARIEGVGGS